MRPRISGVTTRGASLTWLAGAVFTGSSCRHDSSVGPTDPGNVADAGSAAAGATAAQLSFYQVSPGNAHTCGVTTESRLYCWGYNSSGQLGDGTTIDRLIPVAVATGLRFRAVNAGLNNTCAITTGYRAYCWGWNGLGQLGDGTTIDRLTPRAVAGGRQFRQVAMNNCHACSVGFTDSRGYCWGSNIEGQLGDGSTTSRLKPVPVAGALRFRQISPGGVHTCGVTTDNRAFCWGNNGYGQIGDRSEVVRRRLRPTLVAGGYQFRQLDAGRNHTCAVTTGNRAYCWGNGREGQIGNGKAYLSYWPRAVAGGLSFDRVTAGDVHTCGEALDRAYCWGSNVWGQLGDGTETSHLTPVAVAGGLSFSQVSAGNLHTCGKTDAAVAYCWGYNRLGDLGDGTTETRLHPVPVAGTM